MDHTAFVSKQHHNLRHVSLLAPNYVQVEYIILLITISRRVIQRKFPLSIMTVMVL